MLWVIIVWKFQSKLTQIYVLYNLVRGRSKCQFLKIVYSGVFSKLNIPIWSIVSQTCMQRIMIFCAFFKTIEIFIYILSDSMPGHVFQIFDSIESSVSSGISWSRHPKTVKEKFRLGAFRVIVLQAFFLFSVKVID